MLNRNERDLLAKRIIQYHHERSGGNSKMIWNHFKEEGIPKSTLYGILARFRKTGKIETKSPAGRKPKIMGPEAIKAVKKVFQAGPSVSENVAAKKASLERSTIGHIKRHKLGFKSWVKSKAPEYKGDEEERSEKNAHRIYRKLSKIPAGNLLMDDETYVPVDPKTSPWETFLHKR